jgi:hypothetical protein
LKVPSRCTDPSTSKDPQASPARPSSRSSMKTAKSEEGVNW